MTAGRGRMPTPVLDFPVAALGTPHHDIFNHLTEGFFAIGHHCAGSVPISLAVVSDLLAIRTDDLNLPPRLSHPRARSW